ncbi:hypothetical protein SCHPADRAFT_476230 [Schizopora paradoxa]|uniref:Uncharacterized protein n=1 Tax=Schizopora paradoxa TaxID=27342 RepID=A0A0H2RI40_9AGAM|nr:hypothetical protein SCHPADRAFT_476230 [Schizopora paradoxa]
MGFNGGLLGVKVKRTPARCANIFDSDSEAERVDSPFKAVIAAPLLLLLCCLAALLARAYTQAYALRVSCETRRRKQTFRRDVSIHHSMINIIFPFPSFPLLPWHLAGNIGDVSAYLLPSIFPRDLRSSPGWGRADLSRCKRVRGKFQITHAAAKTGGFAFPSFFEVLHDRGTRSF